MNCCGMLGVIALMLNAYGASTRLELFRVVDLQLPERLKGVMPDFKEEMGPGVWEEGFLFSAHPAKNGLFDLYYQRVKADVMLDDSLSCAESVCDLVVTGCVRATISQSARYSRGWILDCAKNAKKIDESWQFSHCSMYLLKRERSGLKVVSFADEASRVGMFSYAIYESLYRGIDLKSNELSTVWILRRDDTKEDAPPKWSIIEAKINLNTFSNISERVLISYESYDPPGLSM